MTTTSIDTDTSYAVSLTRHLISLYGGNSLTDISVTCGSETFDLHSPVLSHGSGYFCKILNDDTENVFESPSIALDFIPPIEPRTFRIIVDSLYTGIARGVDEMNVTDVFEGSHHLDVSHAKSACVDYMLRHLDIDNCLQYWLSARLCNNTKVKSTAIRLIGRHIDHVSKTSLFLELDSDIVMEILSDDELQVSSEVDAYEAAMAWLKYDHDGRVGNLSNMLDSIRLDLLPVKYLVDVVGKEDLIEDNSGAMSKYSKALKSKLGGEKISIKKKARHNMMHGMRGGYEKLSKSMRSISVANDQVKEVEEIMHDTEDAVPPADDDSQLEGSEEFQYGEAKQRSIISIPQGHLFNKCCDPQDSNGTESDNSDSDPTAKVKEAFENLTTNVQEVLSNVSKTLKEAGEKLFEADPESFSRSKVGVDANADADSDAVTGVDEDDTQEISTKLVEVDGGVLEVEEDISITTSVRTPLKDDMDGLSLATIVENPTPTDTLKSLSQDPADEEANIVTDSDNEDEYMA